MRLSLGAGRARLLRQLLTESVLLAALGGVGGVALAVWGIGALRAWNPGELPRIQDVHLDLGALAFTAAISLAAGLLAGLAPALQATRTTLSASLKERGRGTAGAARRRTLAALVVAETALSLILLTGAGLLVKSFLLLQHTDFGIAAQAEYLDAAMTVLRVSRAVIVGVDLGGDVAMKLAANRPERVEKLVLINTPAFDELPAKEITQMQRRTARFAFSLTRGVMGAAPLLEGVLKGSVADPRELM